MDRDFPISQFDDKGVKMFSKCYSRIKEKYVDPTNETRKWWDDWFSGDMPTVDAESYRSIHRLYLPFRPFFMSIDTKYNPIWNLSNIIDENSEKESKRKPLNFSKETSL